MGDDGERVVPGVVAYIWRVIERIPHYEHATQWIVGSPEFPPLLTPSIAQRPNAEGDYPSRDPGDQSRPVWQSPDNLSREIGTETLQQETSSDADGADESPVHPRDSPSTAPVPDR